MTLPGEKPLANLESLPQPADATAVERLVSESGRIIRGIVRRSKGLVEVQKFNRHIEKVSRGDLITLGSEYGGWTVPESLLDSDSVCYLVGVGADTTFDEELMDRFGIKQVWAFDPTDGSARHVERLNKPGYNYMQVGISDHDGEETLYTGWSEGDISLLASGERSAGTFPMRSIGSLMRQYDHSVPDLIKICAEGGEYKIIESLLNDGILPVILAVEYARRHPGNDPMDNYGKLVAAGYSLVHASLPPGNDWKVTYVHEAEQR